MIHLRNFIFENIFPAYVQIHIQAHLVHHLIWNKVTYDSMRVKYNNFVT